MLRFRSKSKVKRIPRNPFRLRPTGLASRWLTALPAWLPFGSRRFCRQMRLRLLRLGDGKARSRDFQLFSHTDIDDDDCRLNPAAEKKVLTCLTPCEIPDRGDSRTICDGVELKMESNRLPSGSHF